MRGIIIAVLLFPLGALAQAPIAGVLLERGTRKPLKDVNIYLLPIKRKATTTGDGSFIFPSVPLGKYQIVVNSTGYDRLDRELLVTDSVPGNLQLFLERISYLPSFETTIYDKGERRDDTTRSLKAKEFLKAPGAGGDPIKAVQNLPGIARPSGFNSRVSIQGSAPRDTRYLINGHEVPLIFHFGGLTSVVFPEALDRVDYLSAGFGPEYGRAVGGLVGVWTKRPRTDRLHGLAFVDLLNAGVLLEGPIKKKKSSFMFGARKSYIGEVLSLVAKDNEDFNLTVAPSYADLVGLYRQELASDSHFELLTVGSSDALEFVLANPVNQDPALRGRFENRTSFIRVIPQYTIKHSPETTGRYSLGVGKNWTNVNTDENFFNLQRIDISTRAEWERKLTKKWKAYLGLDNLFYFAKVNLNLPFFFSEGGVANPISSGETINVDVSQTTYLFGAYWRNELNFEPWTLFPSLRLAYYGQTKQPLPMPRLAARYELSPYTFLRSAGGLYYQPPRPQDTSEAVGNPDLNAPRAWHATLGIEKDFREGESNGVTASFGGFYRWFNQLVINSTDTIERNGETVLEKYSNKGKGRSFGFELALRGSLKPWNGTLAYTISRSTRTEPGQAEHVFRFDQTHNINTIIGVDLPGNWSFSTRFRYVTGNPFTPITGSVFDADNDVYLPLRGDFFSERVRPFAQLDLRIDKKWIYDTWILTAFLDIQNVTNRANVETVRYAFDYSKKVELTGLPFLPTLGVKAEF